MNSEATFSISVTGEQTGEKYFGSFKVRVMLTHRQQLLQEMKRRELLGPDPHGAASSRSQNQAEILSQLFVRIIDSPSWWVNSDGGLDVVDDSPILEVFNRTMEAERDAVAAIKKTAEETKKELKTIAEERK